jgi:uncharacterized RDD family membrane protein YckC
VAVTPRRSGPLERLPQAIAEQVVSRIIELIDVNEIVSRIDVNDVVNRIDVNALMERVDVNAVVDRVDPDELLDRVDPNRLMERVDIEAIVDRIDVNAIAEKIDVEAIANRIDVDELVRRADLGPIIAQSTSGMMGEFLGLLRRQVVSLDKILDRLTLRKRFADQPVGPPELIDSETRLVKDTLEGHFAGGVTRLLAFLADIGAAWGIFLVLVAGTQAAIKLFSGGNWTLDKHRLAGLIAITIWGFLYFSVQWSLSGRTIGMAILGARVTTVEGRSISKRSAAIRTVTLPLSIIVLFLGLFGIVLRANRQGFHDRCAGTVVVYFWEARGSSLPWLHHDD